MIDNYFMLFSACCINFLTMLPPTLPASFEEISPLYPCFKLTPTSIGVKNIFEKQSPKINTYTAYNTSYSAYKTIKNMQNTIDFMHIK